MKQQPEFQYGGQAVIEGVMMRGRDYQAVAVRKANGEIVIQKTPVGSITKKYPFLKWPFIRGIVGLCESLGIGMKALMFSADQYMDDGETDAKGEPNKLSGWETTLTIGLALALTIVLFILLPLWGRSLLGKILPGHFWGNIFENVIRVLILVGYIAAVSSMNDIKRVFAYHGAEHKVINTFEAKEDLTVENARKHTTFHPRCGTSFLLFVVIVSAVFFAFLRYDTGWMRFASRIILLPVVAGVSYEIIKFTGRHQDFFLWRWISTPGFWLQRLTTREPDDAQLEVAINSLVAVLREEAPIIVGGKIYTAEKVEVANSTTAS